MIKDGREDASAPESDGGAKAVSLDYNRCHNYGITFFLDQK